VYNILIFILFFLAFLISLALVGAIYYFDIMSVKKANEAISAKQASHTRPTSRVGGLAAFISLVIGVFLVADQSILLIVLSSTPVLMAGFLDDLGYNIKPVYRFYAAMGSGFLAIYLTGLWLDNVDFTILTPILALAPIAVCFTAFASAGVSNSINLIDGVNGLASGVIILIGIALSIISFSVGEVGLGTFCIVLVGSVLGFFIWNFPKGLIFLGDAGAYTFGHLLVWVAISLVTKHPEISAWAIFCLFFWPIMDTIAAIFRRCMKQNSINKADHLHFHQLVMRALVIYSNGRISQNLANPLSTIIILPFCILVVVFGILFLENNFFSILTIFFATFMFFGSYNLLVFTIRSKIYRKFIKN
jgi:UDP-GlcNAc:undecaprenyl-phosphate/decaprenyl-phosphate GlcNAc-1-phosphate transferase